MTKERKIYINNDLDVVTARLQARKMAEEMGFRTADQARISLAASELARVLSWNTDLPSQIIMSDTTQNGYQGLQLTCAVQSQYLASNNEYDDSTLTSQHHRSLTGACRLVDESIVEELGNQQALVRLIKWLR